MKLTDKITITNEDNIELMARYPDNYFDLAIVDPPYGNIDAIGLTDNKKQGKQATKRKGYHLFENIAPENKYYLELERVSKNQIIWGGNFLGFVVVLLFGIKMGLHLVNVKLLFVLHIKACRYLSILGMECYKGI